MIDTIREFFKELAGSQDTSLPISDSELHLISAALMTEVIVSDGNTGSSETDVLKRVLIDEFKFQPGDVDTLVKEALKRVENATSLFEFTDVVNQNFKDEEKFRLISHLWQIAHADGEIHKLEEATIRKISDLIYLPHSAFIRAKQLSR